MSSTPVQRVNGAGAVEVARAILALASIVAWPAIVVLSIPLVLSATGYAEMCRTDAAYGFLLLLIPSVAVSAVGVWVGRAHRFRRLVKWAQVGAIILVFVCVVIAVFVVLFALSVAETRAAQTPGIVGVITLPVFVAANLLLCAYPLAARSLPTRFYYPIWGGLVIALVVLLFVLRVADASLTCH